MNQLVGSWFNSTLLTDRHSAIVTSESIKRVYREQ